MIEMIYKGNAKNGNQQERKALPKNIRQIGEAGKTERVYIEDYAETFLEGTEYAVLLGEIWQNKTMKCLFVDGVLKVEPEIFGDEMWESVYRDAKRHFPGREILGWAKKTDDCEEEPAEEVLDMHMEQFPGEDKLLILHDGENENSVYLTQAAGIQKQKGYCIYYEKNEQMQNYMVKENAGKSVEAEEGAEDGAIRNFRRMLAQKQRQAKEEAQVSSHGSLTMRFLYGASMFLVLTILVIGVTMINNYNRMKDMEATLSEMARGEAGEKAVKANAWTGETEWKEEKESEPMTAGTESGSTWNQSAGNVQEQPSQDGWMGETGTEGNGQEGLPNEGMQNLENENTGAAQTESIQNESIQNESDGNTGEWKTDTSQNWDGGGIENQTAGEDAVPQNRAAEASSVQVQRMQAEYTVRDGDTLATVCRMYYGTLDKLEEICTLNGIADPNTILPGQKLLLP